MLGEHVLLLVVGILALRLQTTAECVIYVSLHDVIQ